MDTLIDVLQHQIPEIEKLETAADLEALRNKALVVSQKITAFSKGYAAENKELAAVSGHIPHLDATDKKGFLKAKEKVLRILNTILEMED